MTSEKVLNRSILRKNKYLWESVATNKIVGLGIHDLERHHATKKGEKPKRAGEVGGCPATMEYLTRGGG